MSVTESTYPFWLAGSAHAGDASYSVVSPYTDEVVAEVALAGADDVERALAAAEEAFAQTASLPAHARATALSNVALRIREEADALAQLITAESGKPIRWARIEVARSAANYQRAAEEAKRFAGELVRLDEDPVGTGRVGLVRRFPIGPVLGITPFNFPMNLVSHKVAPAIAVGAPIILKPAPQTPLTALRIAELVAETGLPDGSVSVLPVRMATLLDSLVHDPRVPIVSYTGSQVGLGHPGLRAAQARPARARRERGRHRPRRCRRRAGRAIGRPRRVHPGRPDVHLDPAGLRPPIDRTAVRRRAR